MLNLVNHYNRTVENYKSKEKKNYIIILHNLHLFNAINIIDQTLTNINKLKPSFNQEVYIQLSKKIETKKIVRMWANPQDFKTRNIKIKQLD